MTELQRLMRDFARDDAGTPLGIGMPIGGPLRADGQSHYEAWQSLLRRDPCSYCGAVGGAGTVDHVDPRSRAARGFGTVHGWVNTVGACTGCNGAKRDLDLLVFLYRRRWKGAIVRPGSPARASRRIVRRWPPEATAHLRVGRAGRRHGASVPLR
ncbi:MAG TPA: HNH endonuclease [Solirubrobacteraceae bacterium]|nr:HNH endonuclease [Solirubrobacteraceae bacterium]